MKEAFPEDVEKKEGQVISEFLDLLVGVLKKGTKEIEEKLAREEKEESQAGLGLKAKEEGQDLGAQLEAEALGAQ